MPCRHRTPLLVARLPLYGRFLAILGIICSSSGLVGGAAAWIGRLLILLILSRRWLRCQRHLPSRHCRSVRGQPLKPTVQGLHRRFLELYSNFEGDGRGSIQATEDDEIAGMQQLLTLADGQRLAYWDVGPKSAETVVLLCNGLGARVAGWTPLLDALHSEWPEWRHCRLVIPEYRGQFSSVPLVGEAVSVERSATDISDLTTALGIQRATLLCWSTGVQVGLQLALDRSDLVVSMALIQGTTGQALDCIMQPPCTIPGVPTLLTMVLRYAPRLLCSGRCTALHGAMVRRTLTLERFGRWTLWWLGSDLIPSTAVRYGQDMIHTADHFEHYCGYAEALGRHRVLARLGDIQAPALVVTGTPDFVTPARCSYDMAARLGGSAELLDDIGGSHYYIFEEPHKLARKLAAFLRDTTGKQTPEACIEP